MLSLKRQTDGEMGDFVLSEEHEPKEFSKLAALVTDPFSLELSSKKISTKLTQEASRTARELDDDLRRIMSDINSLAAKISALMEFETVFTELEGADALMKMLDFCIDEAELSFPEAILEYMKLQRVFFNAAPTRATFWPARSASARFLRPFLGNIFRCVKPANTVTNFFNI